MSWATSFSTPSSQFGVQPVDANRGTLPVVSLESADTVLRVQARTLTGAPGEAAQVLALMIDFQLGRQHVGGYRFAGAGVEPDFAAASGALCWWRQRLLMQGRVWSPSAA
ncbi:MAG: hypothetical protein IPH35_23460 [Rhodoferax sp.]|nr:hypothetical protein [Rhodoferax sp.]